MIEKLKDTLLFKHSNAMVGSEKPPYDQQVLGKECDKWVTVDYRGTMTRPLESFGEFQVKPETEKLPWISDNTSGKVHPDMRTISMLFNEDLTLPKVAENFIAQSPVLQEEARWERVKAAFYSFHPEDVQQQVFEVLSEMLPRKASQIIAMKTLRFENEIILTAKPKRTTLDDESDAETEPDLKVADDNCTEKDAIKVNKQLPKIAREHRKQTALVLKRHKSFNEKLSSHCSFSLDELKFCWGETKRSKWEKRVEKYKEATQKCTVARFISHHLDHAVARYDPRTGWIHVKTQLLRPGLKEKKSLPKDIFKFKLDSTSEIKGSTEAQNAAVDKQMELFEKELRDISNGHLASLDSYHNAFLYQEFDVRISFDRTEPSLCRSKVEKLGWRDFHIASQPQVHRIQTLYHVLKVYVNIKEAKYWIQHGYGCFGVITESTNRHGCCLNCFSKGHESVRCKQPVYDFASLMKVKGVN